MYSCTTHIININQAGVGYYLHREGPNLGKNIMSLVSCYHPALTHSSGPPTRDPPVLTPTLVFMRRAYLATGRSPCLRLRYYRLGPLPGQASAVPTNGLPK